MKFQFRLSRKIVIATVIIVILSGFTLIVVNSGPLAPVRVESVVAERGRIIPALFGIGIVEAQRSYQIGPVIPGRVLAVNVDVGDVVSEGELLAEMDPVDLEQRLSALSAAVAREQNAVAAAKEYRRDAAANKFVATANAERYKNLGQKKLVSISLVEDKVQAKVSANAQFSAADWNFKAAQQEHTRLQSEHDALNKQRENLRLRTPVDAVVISRDAEPGSTLVAGQPVMQLVDTTSLWIKVRIDQGQSTALRVGLPANIVLRSDSSNTLSGSVIRVDPVSDSVTEERIAYIAFEKIPALLSVGELAEVTLNSAPDDTQIVLPNASIRYQPSGTGVWLLESKRLRFTPVSIGLTGLNGLVQITGGLQSGAQVVVYSEQEINANSRIRVVKKLIEPKS